MKTIWFKDSTGLYMEREYFSKVHESFECSNLQKTRQRQMWFWGWQKLPDIIRHYEVVGRNLIKIPLGYYGFKPELFEDRTPEFKSITLPEIKWQLRDEQVQVISSLMKESVWLLHASTATGKTYMVTGILKSLNLKTLIICDSIWRMTQMQQDLEDIFWVKYQTLSGKKSKKNDQLNNSIVIANIDSVTKMSKEWIGEFGTILLDETDRYLQSDNRREWIGSLSPKYLYGLTGTIKLNHVEDKVFPIYLWPKTEYIVKNFVPNIHQIYTDFEYSDWQLDDMKEFYKLKQELYADSKRNDLIITTIIDTIWTRKWIVFCEYIEHSKLLKTELEKEWIKCFLIIGEISGEEREAIRIEMTDYKWRCLLIWSKVCIWRGLNIPELSVGYLTISEKFSTSVEQFVWRIIRKFPWKTTVDWYDFIDKNVWILANQWRARATVCKREFSGCKFVQHFSEDNTF